MGMEKRRSKRTDINVTIQLKTLKSGAAEENQAEKISVNVVNISKDGIGFKTVEKLQIDDLYDTQIVLSNGESFWSVIAITRIEDIGEEEYLYGCRFLGINAADQFRIEVYQALDEHNLA